MLPDYGLVMGPNVVAGLCEAAKLCAGSKVTIDNLFCSLDLIDYMSTKKIEIFGNRPPKQDV